MPSTYIFHPPLLAPTVAAVWFTSFLVVDVTLLILPLLYFSNES
jgi:hypothetical protein